MASTPIDIDPEQLKKEAERYRWIRDEAKAMADHRCVMPIIPTEGNLHNLNPYKRQAAFDEAVDKAMNGKDLRD